MWNGYPLYVRRQGRCIPRRWRAFYSFLPLPDTNVPQILQIDMSNIIDQAVKIIEANGFKDSVLSLVLRGPFFSHFFSSASYHPREGKTRGYRAPNQTI